MIRSQIIVRFQIEGFHKWDNAPQHRMYLANLHRHIFHVEARVEVKADNREIEFHDFLDFCQENFGGGDLQGQSCEMMARKLLDKITTRYDGRAASVSVFEDGEVGAQVNYWPV